MNIITQLQEVSKEDATKLVHQTLSSMAIDALTEVKKEVTYAYSEKNPKIDLHNKHNGMYIASTNWAKNVKDAVAHYEEKNPDMKGHVRGYIADKK